MNNTDVIGPRDCPEDYEPVCRYLMSNGKCELTFDGDDYRSLCECNYHSDDFNEWCERYIEEHGRPYADEEYED